MMRGRGESKPLYNKVDTVVEWPPECIECERRFKQPYARLFPLIGKDVLTPEGRGSLFRVFEDSIGVVLDRDMDRVVFFSDWRQIVPLQEFEGTVS